MLVSDDGTRTNLITEGSGDSSAASWSPDGQRIAYVERATEYFSGALKVMHFQANEILCRHLFHEVDRRVQAYKSEIGAAA